MMRNDTYRAYPPSAKQEEMLRLYECYEGNETRGTASDKITEIMEKEEVKRILLSPSTIFLRRFKILAKKILSTKIKKQLS